MLLYRLIWFLLPLLELTVGPAPADELREISRSELEDRIRGGWAGQMIGNIQGLPFEFKYKDAPGPLPDFTPNLPRCPSDDDTDIEWVHLHAMSRTKSLEVPYPELATQWIQSINRKVWVSNKRARALMGRGVVPPWTSHPALNSHARYNLSGQFCVEAYGLIAPGLPARAARIGAHYAKITVRGEPVQACAYWTSMIALAFFEKDIRPLAERCLDAVDPASEHAEMVRDVLTWQEQMPGDWRGTRARIQEKYRDQRGWNMNATVTNGAFVLTALLYGDGDFVRTLRLAFALGYDADCNAATCGAVLGVMLGARALESRPGWVLPSHYDNRTRDGLPKTQSLEELVALTADLAERTLLEAGGARSEKEGEIYYRIPVQGPALLEKIEKIEKTPEEATREEVEDRLDREALQRLEADASPARALAAIWLARPEGPSLTASQARKVRRALEEVREDAVLGEMATKALHPDRPPPP